MIRNLALLLLLFTLASVGCKPSPPPSTLQTTETTPPVTIDLSKRGDKGARAVPRPIPADIAPEAFCPLFSSTACRKMFACAEPEVLAIDAANLQFTNEASCQEGMMRFCGSMMLAGIEGSVKAGRVLWDGASFGRCFRTWVAQGCAVPYADLPATPDCRGASTGTVSPGGECTTAFDCAAAPDDTEIMCAFPESGPGICKPLGNPGAACAFNTDCRHDLRCREDTCQPPGQEGQACRFKEDCAAGLLCPDAAEVCTNPLKRGK